MEDQLKSQVLFDQLLKDQLEMNKKWTEVKNQLTNEKVCLQKVVAKLNNEIHLLLNKLRESEKVRF